MDIDLREKVDTLSAHFTDSEAFRNTSFNNPYPKLSQALEQHARPQDSKIIMAVLDDIVAHKNPVETLKGATEGNAIDVLTQLVNDEKIRPIIDQSAYESAVHTISSTVLRMAEAQILQNQTKREMLHEQQTGH